MAGNYERATAMLESSHQRIIEQMSMLEPDGGFVDDRWDSALGSGISSVVTGGSVWEKAGVNFSSVGGNALPAAASATRPELAGKPWQACGVSVVIHPKNPHAPTSHANFRVFSVGAGNGNVMWFGGGFDLTPYYPYTEDCVLWHREAKQACDRTGADLYPQFKSQCDDYFYLPHRGETRGIGGLFFDDFALSSFEDTLSFMQSLVGAYCSAYTTIVNKRKGLSFDAAQRAYQCYRRGRYVEFNLLYDRGTLFGLQSKGRVESILMSLPPMVSWHYQYQLNPDEKNMIDYYFQPRDWLAL